MSEAVVTVFEQMLPSLHSFMMKAVGVADDIPGPTKCMDCLHDRLQKPA